MKSVEQQIKDLKTSLIRAIQNDKFELAVTIKEDIKTIEVRQHAL